MVAYPLAELKKTQLQRNGYNIPAFLNNLFPVVGNVDRDVAPAASQTYISEPILITGSNRFSVSFRENYLPNIGWGIDTAKRMTGSVINTDLYLNSSPNVTLYESGIYPSGKLGCVGFLRPVRHAITLEERWQIRWTWIDSLCASFVSSENGDRGSFADFIFDDNTRRYLWYIDNFAPNSMTYILIDLHSDLLGEIRISRA
jgi:hypothetical protein